ncbi:MAG: NAD(+)/NADH kinase [Myxococcales bacterium]|nr:NAD(+)/NADH kinase [Myxococcales bacterium]
MRFGFVLKRGKEEARHVARDLIELLGSLGCASVMPREDVAGDATEFPGATLVPGQELGPAIDALVVLGGDGTFLHGAGLVADHGVPLLGINLGSLGFMTHWTLPEARDVVRAAASGQLDVEERMRLRVSVVENGTTVVERNALNEAVLTQRSMARLLDLEAESDGQPIASFKADGVIVASPTGSTAYSLAAGGPILTPQVDAMVLTPICPHTLTYRPVVLRADRRLIVKNVSPSMVSLTLDGQWGRELPPGAHVEVSKAERPARLYRPNHPFFTVLRQKLRWGERQG